MSNETIRANPNNWLQQYGDLLFQYTLPRVNEKEIAEDLVQETFLAALKGLAGYKGEASEKNWLFSILKNKIVDHYRKKAAAKEISNMTDLQAPDEDWFDAEGHWAENKLPQEWKTVENPGERKEIQKVINWCKDNLKELQKHVFTLKYLEDLESDEICKVLNISTSNYWVLVHRARLQMRDCVQKNWV